MKVRVRSILLLAASLAVAIELLRLLSAMSGVRWRVVFLQLASADRTAFAGLVLCLALSYFLSSQKWQLTQKAMSTHSCEAVPRSTGFALTCIGAALGQFLPVYLSMSAVRTMGTWAYGKALQRGTVATVFEQAFDFGVVGYLILVSAGTRFFHGGAKLWLALALTTTALAMWIVGLIIRGIRCFADARIPADAQPTGYRRYVVELRDSNLLKPSVARQLLALSAARFFLLVLMAGQVTAAIHSSIPTWQLAAAMPFAVVAAVVGITPGGLGVTEFAIANALTLFGTPIIAGTQWAMANRLLSTAAGLSVGLVAVLFLLAQKLQRKAEKKRSDDPIAVAILTSNQVVDDVK